MSESSAQDRTERATPKRLQEARERGQLPRSRELATLVMVAAAVGLLMALGPLALQGLAGGFAAGLRLDPASLTGSADLPAALARQLGAALFALLPVFGGLLVAALCAPLLIGGWNWSSEALQPDLGRLSPLKGLGRLFSREALAEVGKGLLKAGLLVGIAVLMLWASLPELLSLGRLTLPQALASALGLLLGALLALCGGLAVIAAVDVPLQLRRHQRELRMTKQEIREEYKQSEGRPEVKARVRRLQQQMANARMMEQVPKADVVLTNPTHYAVALKYQPGKPGAPRVVAKGVDEVALRIREAARRHGVPQLEAPPLARALYRGVALDQEIPPRLYGAVAQVLGWVYRLRLQPGAQAPVIGAVEGGEPDPSPPSPPG
ncbi:MAG TPA: flagellar biosynthesis protein FlhB [Nevskiaceae bacterium]|nr:flagellar biosynthesis protein FlhB [Nevskiaceae bacterium]